ncbi:MULTISPECIES: hypothetical protein [Enterobacter]|uniref:hypothetical protein n=1 Tax=Enterobacter TaxID=547 RepID=UPI001BD601D4|nr:hypothetical protein [Enterobacter sp. AN-K1]EHN8809159.1 hypothetical protein [Enterobacter hormaechei]MCI9496881.1 hypothetical protein [Enterobacter hormaechei subsp. steigerwaltii]ELD3424538.1 hypothetical protein [Enterobacter hormaechei]MCM7579776.1 hypothetical protein [Enterobacter hormaechei]UFK53008.1 hypothetical protein LOC22_21915 [Enterobacter sp. AN-K1]
MQTKLIAELKKIEHGIKKNSGKKIPYSHPAYDQLIEDFSAQDKIFKDVDPNDVDYQIAHDLILAIDNELTALHDREQIMGSFGDNLPSRPPFKRL